MPERIGCIALREGGGLIGAFMSGFKWIDPLDAITPIVDPEPDRPGNRFNDGKCDRRGRLFAGTMDNAEVECTGTLYRLIPICPCTSWVRRASVGLGWSPDDRTLYYTDAPPHDLGLRLRPRHRRHRQPARLRACRIGGGVPDGLCVDAQGGVWSAHWGGWRLTRYAPDGRIDRVVEMPVPQPSCPAFGGPDLDVLYVSSAAIDMTPADFAKARRRRPVHPRRRGSRPAGPSLRRVSDMALQADAAPLAPG